MTPVKLMLVAAEPSGDALGAAVASALRQRLGDRLSLIGAGGPRLAAEGLASAFDITPLSVLGVTDALRIWPLVRRRAAELGALAAREAPVAAVLIDSWGFNLRAAHRIRQAAPTVDLIKYVAPQVWATRPGRARTLARAVDHLLTINAFDASWFERAGLGVTFVGNPVLARDLSAADPAAFRQAIGAAPDDPLLVVAPGSRLAEVERLMAPFGEAMRRLAADRPRLKVAVLAADAVARTVAHRAAAWAPSVHLVTSEVQRLSAMAAAEAALACSGTVTTELAMSGAPLVVAYRMDPLTYPIARMLIRTRWITLLNVAAGRSVAPEFIQSHCAAERLAAALAPLLDERTARERQVTEQRQALEIMRGGIADPAATAAEAIIRRLPAQLRASIGE